MTITERNNKLYGLRERMAHHIRQAGWCIEEIARVNRVYKDQNLDLYTELFDDDYPN
tara:strand:- start:916 stop:1086 length:171 start_codon:yes stop_codon:yes gene_type:complete